MLGEQIRDLRTAKNLSQVQLADRLGVTKQSVSNWENNNILPSVDMLKHIANYFHCSTDYLLEMNEGKVYIESNKKLDTKNRGRTVVLPRHIKTQLIKSTK